MQSGLSPVLHNIHQLPCTVINWLGQITLETASKRVSGGFTRFRRADVYKDYCGRSTFGGQETMGDKTSLRKAVSSGINAICERAWKRLFKRHRWRNDRFYIGPLKSGSIVPHNGIDLYEPASRQKSTYRRIDFSSCWPVVRLSFTWNETIIILVTELEIEKKN